MIDARHSGGLERGSSDSAGPKARPSSPVNTAGDTVLEIQWSCYETNETVTNTFHGREVGHFIEYPRDTLDYSCLHGTQWGILEG